MLPLHLLGGTKQHHKQCQPEQPVTGQNSNWYLKNKSGTLLLR
jgi:hypothetical protein